MSSGFAVGKRAYGFCDRCGRRYDLAKLYEEFQRGKPVGNRVCRVCYEPDHPQNWLGEGTDYADNQALRWSRPDTAQDDSRRLFAWDPVGSNMFSLKASLGRVTVVTS